MLEKEEVDWQLYNFVVRGQRRISVIKILDGEIPKTPTQISRNLKCAFNASDRSLKEFEKLGIIKCLNPEHKTGKLFILTREGEKIKNILLKTEVQNSNL